MIITGEMAKIAQALLKDTTFSLVEANWETLTPLQLTPGQMVHGEVMANLPNSRYLVRVANEMLRMEIPLNLQPGQTVEMTYVTQEPRILFALSRSANSDVPVTISDTGRWLNQLTGEEAPPPAATTLPRLATILTAPPRDTEAFANLLRNALGKSGLFYESHLAEWVRGERPLADLLREPQGSLSRLAAHLPAEQAETSPPTSQGTIVKDEPETAGQASPSPPKTGGQEAPAKSAPGEAAAPDPKAPQAASQQKTAEGTGRAPAEESPASPQPHSQPSAPGKGDNAAAAAPREQAPQLSGEVPTKPAQQAQPAKQTQEAQQNQGPQRTQDSPQAPQSQQATQAHQPGHTQPPPQPQGPGTPPLPEEPPPTTAARSDTAGTASAKPEATPAQEKAPLHTGGEQAPAPRQAADDVSPKPVPREAEPRPTQPHEPHDPAKAAPRSDTPAPEPLRGGPAGTAVAQAGPTEIGEKSGLQGRPIPSTPAFVEPQTIPIIREQLAVLHTGQLAWSGQVWPGQFMEWKVQDREAGSGPEEERSWQTELALDLPNLGGIRATLRLTLDGVTVAVRADDQGTVGTLKGGEERLRESMEAAGIRVAGIMVRHGEE